VREKINGLERRRGSTVEETLEMCKNRKRTSVLVFHALEELTEIN